MPGRLPHAGHTQPSTHKRMPCQRMYAQFASRKFAPSLTPPAWCPWWRRPCRVKQTRLDPWVAPLVPRRYVNREGLDFDTASTLPPVQEWQLAEDRQGVMEYPTQ